MCAGVDDALPCEQRRSEVVATCIEGVQGVDRGGEVEQLRFDVGRCDRLVDRDRQPADARRSVGIPSADRRAAGSVSPQNAKDMCSGMYVACRRVEHG